MPNVDLNDIANDLNQRFLSPLPDFCRRRIVFWHDEDREFEDMLSDVQIPDVKLAVLTGSNSFAVKKMLIEDGPGSNYLVYCPIAYRKSEDNWLINIELYSEEFRADLNSIWMDEMRLPSSPVLRAQVKSYRKFFNSKERRAKFSALGKSIQTTSQMHLAVMATICGLKETRPSGIIRAVLCAGLDKDKNVVYQNMVSYGTVNPFWIMVRQATGYSEGDDASLARFAEHLLLTAATRTLSIEVLAGLDNRISLPHQSFCYELVSEWLYGQDAARLRQIACHVEDIVRLPQRFSQIAAESLADTEIFPCVNECILLQLMTEIGDHIINTDAIAHMVDKRRTMAWYNEFACYFDGILQVANMQGFFHDHADGFHTVEPRGIWKKYTEKYYRMDSFYRLFHLAFAQSLTHGNVVLDDLFKRVAENVEGLYANWFLKGLGANWSDACAEDLEKHGYIMEVPRQENFYGSKVRPADTRVFVIISDALRYEVAAALAEQLRRETQSKVNLSSCQAIFPTITKFGMAALLPHKELKIDAHADKLSVWADGSPTDSGYRDRILKTANKASVALQYKELIKMKSADRREQAKGMEVVYIYHDTIDEASHTADSAVFLACEEAIQEIKNLVRIIVNEFSGTNIVITADHGFLYTYSPLKEDNKLGKASFDQHDVEYGRRYAILHKGVLPEYLLPVKFMGGKTDYDAFAPRETIRIKMNGGGLNFVHGGISLQEMVVPVIDYRYLRNDSKTYQRNKAKYDTKPVTLSLIAASHKITNMIFSLSFYQTESVSDNREAAGYTLYFTDVSGKQISDVQRIIADKTNANVQERTFRVNFNLKQMKYSNTEPYYLVLADESGTQMPQKIEFQIDIAFSLDEFNFFGE